MLFVRFTALAWIAPLMLALLLRFTEEFGAWMRTARAELKLLPKFTCVPALVLPMTRSCRVEGFALALTIPALLLRFTEPLPLPQCSGVSK